jgi:diacylglycerol kinase (ATP)
MIVCGAILGFSRTEWIVVVLCIGAVLGAEAFNTAIEKMCDHLHPQQHPEIGKVKDLAAGAVLLVSIAAAVCGVMILLDHFCGFFCATSAFTGSIP